MMQQKLFIFFQRIAPKHLLSRAAGWVTNSRIKWLKNFIIAWFVKAYNVDMTAAIQPDPLQYPTFNSFFTRHLKPEARPLAGDANTLIFPCDGTLCQMGKIQKNRLIQAKGFDYSASDLLGSAESAAAFLNGSFMTIYLAPKDYHRVHMPFAGRLLKMIYIPGTLFSVNTLTADNIPRLFARNERVVCLFETSIGPMAVILVGAMLVASISTVWQENIAPCSSKTIKTWDYTNSLIQLKRGDELGHFKLGSTVIVLFPGDQLIPSDALQLDQSVQFGQKITELALSEACAML